MDELDGHESAITCMGFANMHIWTGSADTTIRNWDYYDLQERIRERKTMKKIELYSFKAEVYSSLLFDKKKKKGRKGKKGRRR